jgi:hypothetical protein
MEIPEAETAVAALEAVRAEYTESSDSVLELFGLQWTSCASRYPRVAGNLIGVGSAVLGAELDLELEEDPAVVRGAGVKGIVSSPS